jgi:hypothetical protein
VTIGAQASDNRGIDALVSQQLHATDFFSG